MLYPQLNRCRTVIDLSGFWEFTPDDNEDNRNGFQPLAVVGIPGSWNEQLAELDLMNHVGKIWFQKRFFIPCTLANSRLQLRFGSVDFHARVWLNGKPVGEHSSGFLPFEFDICDHILPDQEQLLVVCVDNRLSHDTIPQGVTAEDYHSFHLQRHQTFPPTVFDFFAYGGIHRPVKLTALHQIHIQSINLESRIKGADGHIRFQGDVSHDEGGITIKASLWDGHVAKTIIEQKVAGSKFQGEIQVKQARFWSDKDPHLYQLHFQLFDHAILVDEYHLPVGIREVKVDDKNLLLNNQPIFLRGFGKHEDFAVLGKGFSPALIAKDFQLLKWIGANSFRTSHYPYAEEVLQLADQMGFLVIAEVPAVSLNFRFATEQTLENHTSVIKKMIERDRNHPSVIAWSLGNEPGIWGEEEARSEKADRYWQQIFAFARKLDPGRPLTLPTFPRWKDQDLVYRYCDFISINRYWGWYEVPAEIDKAGAILKSELEKLYATYHKPILVSEFGADAIEGMHATYPQLFTEEYQTDLIKKYFEVIESLPYTIGEHIWNFADFRTAQHFRRVVLNKKGVFNRQREPKAAAFAIRNHWKAKS